MNTYTVAFVGNPNVGKSAWINLLSGSNFKVGNWPGVTVEKKEADVEWGGNHFHLIDLPGTYALNDSDNEESITADYLRREQIDLIVNVVDATRLERNLLLTLQLRQLQKPMIVILNFIDEVEKFGIQIEVGKLSRRLQLPIIPSCALKVENLTLIKDQILKNLQNQNCYFPLLDGEDAKKYVHICSFFKNKLPEAMSNDQTLHLITINLIEQDPLIIRQLRQLYVPLDTLEEDIAYLSKNWSRLRYQMVNSLMKYVKDNEIMKLKRTRAIDKVLLHKYWGLPICALIFTLLLCIIFNGSSPFNDFIDYLINDIVAKYVFYFISFLPEALQQLILKGILAGVGGVLTFVPLMFFLYVGLAILEESGYMSRIAFLLDKLMRNFHLSGKSFVSLLLGFGCNVPAIYATRTLDNEKQKRLTALLIPFMSCGARLPVYVLFAAAFFKGKAAVMILTVYGMGILLALIMALIFSKSQKWKSDQLFILELPPYRLPNGKVIYQKVKQEVMAYVKKATGIVLWAMILLWGLSYFPNGRIQDSYIASFAKSTTFIFEPLGFGNRWESIAALPGSIVAKETVVGFFDQILLHNEEKVYDPINPVDDLKSIAYNFGTSLRESLTFLDVNEPEKNDETLVSSISNLWTDKYASLRAFSFMIFISLTIPCIMTLQALYREYGWKLLITSIITMLIVPYTVSLLIFQTFKLFI